MVLSKHQKEIIEKIVSDEVYDIYSYLKAFDKGRNVKYDIALLKSRFEESETDKTYKVMKQGHSTIAYAPQSVNTPLGTFSGMSIPLPRPKKSITDDEWENQPAEFVVDISLSKIEFEQQTYSFDFIEKGVFVADDFKDIIDFISLWTYLKEQSLVLEVNKPIKGEDIGVLYELKPVSETVSQSAIQWESNFGNNVDKTSSKQLELLNEFRHDFLNEAPIRKATSYMDSKWKINEDHKIMCADFLGKKIIANSTLRIFCKNKYKTESEKAQKHSLAVAWIAVFISLVAILIGNIVPLFQPNETDYLRKVIEQVSDIQSSLETISEHNNSQEVSKMLEEVSTKIDKLQVSDYSDILAEINEKLDQ